MERIIQYSNTMVQRPPTHSSSVGQGRGDGAWGVARALVCGPSKKPLHSLCQAHKTAGV